MNYLEEYKSKLVSAEKAASLVKSNDYVVLSVREPLATGLALASRKEELRKVEIYVMAPGYDFGWYDAGWEESFEVTLAVPTATSQQMVDERRCDVSISGLIPMLAPYEVASGERQPDVYIVETSPPDEHGFCSFGVALWEKKRVVEMAKLVIAEVNPNVIRTYGDNFVHISEIDYFVEHTPTGRPPGTGSLTGKAIKEPEPYLKRISENVAELIKDGDTLQIGVGRTTEPLVRLGMLDEKHDLGYHSEATAPGTISLVRNGVITGKYKTLNPGKVVVTSVGGGSLDEMQWVNNNPLLMLVDIRYLADIRTIAAHDNFVAVNNILAIDLSGQITAESLGTRLVGVAGGQIPFVYGSWLSKGGRSISVLPSTAQGGTVSRIMPTLPAGTVVTIQRNLADYVVTEYGIARLKGKPIRKRAQELIAVAHPDFRAELKKEAEKLYWP